MPTYNVYYQFNSYIKTEAKSITDAYEKVKWLKNDEIIKEFEKNNGSRKVVFEAFEESEDTILRCPNCFSRLVYLDAVRQVSVHLSLDGKLPISSPISTKHDFDEIDIELHNTLQCINNLCDFVHDYNFFFRNR
ncbi:hypothetical protein JOC75_003610 [Metabacillus crassostreae]|uniref:hypothetical protein n=1 Tax=Metabacillus crassostreae TaxID=929098 RepID=UPI0019578CFD|nr:hypothetical protein [Metabacillus crassostreae]MBM7605587.1 hypothetical protein [Metabacillus crassostreae]